MKANYLLKSRTGNPYFRRALILILVLLVGGLSAYFFEGATVRIVSPLWRLENFIFGSRRALLAENAMLRERILELERRRDTETSLAAVLSRPPQTFYDIIIVDIGPNSHVAPGFRVFLPDKLPIGVVSEVFARQAKVKLYSAVGEKTNAVLERNDVPVVLVGTGGGNFKTTLPRDVAVEKEDRIISPGLDEGLLAIVEDITARPTESFKEVLAKSPTNIFTLRFVLITP